MGYEIKMYIGKRIELKTKGRDYFSIQAMVDLCKCSYEVNDKIRELKKRYKDNLVCCYMKKNKAVIEDSYGEELVSVPLNEVLKLFEEIEEEYRRYNWALELLISVYNSMSKGEFEVMFYRH